MIYGELGDNERMLTILAFIVVLGVTITVHEFGHFAMAKLLKMLGQGRDEEQCASPVLAAEERPRPAGAARDGQPDVRPIMRVRIAHTRTSQRVKHRSSNESMRIQRCEGENGDEKSRCRLW